jgi:hypothetical protein
MKLAVRVLRDPAWCFLVVGGLVGVLLFLIVPPFMGIDEVSHFARTYQISEGDLVPQKSIYHDFLRKGSGVCLPSDVVHTLELRSAQLFIANLPYVGQDDEHHHPAPAPAPTTTVAPAPTTTTTPSQATTTRDPQCEPGRRYVDISTFAWYSPLPYAVGAVGFAIFRPFHPSVDLLSYVGRFAQLATYLAVVFFAIKRSSRARWPLCIVALLPVAAFQANSLSPDAFTAAMAILVLSSALRILDRPPGPLPRRVLVEATAFTLLLALSKPTYVVVALAYLLPLLDRTRRRDSWVLLVPVVVGGVVSTVWQRATASLFVCDQRFFGIHARPGEQAKTILTQPWRFGGAAATALGDHGTDWIRDVVTIGGRIVDWPTAVAVVVFAGFVVLACQQDRSPVRRLAWRERGGLLVVAVLGYLGVLAGWLLYCNRPEMHVGPGLNARLLLPILPVFFVALAPDGPRATRFARLAVPPALALVVFYAVWVVEVARSMG